MDRDTLVRMWTEAWDDGIWYTPWSKAVSGLSARQAAWTPAPDRHSRRNWEEPVDVGERAWAQVQTQFADSCRKILDAMQNGAGMERLIYHLPHESYHIGQIMYVRALQGFPPLE